MKAFVLATLVFCLSIQTMAAQSLSTRIGGSYTSIRALGMGNSFTAVADDYSLLFYNPAGLARKPYNEVQISLIGAGVSAKTLTIAKDINDASDTAGTDNDKAQAISDALSEYYGESLGGKIQALEMFWVRKGWGFGFVPVDLDINMSVNRQLGPALDLNIVKDTYFAFGYGKNIDKEFDAGITGKFIHRAAVEQSVSALELATNPDVLSSERFKEGTAIDFDLGFMWTPNWFAKKSESTETKTEEVKAEEVKPEAKADEIKPVEAVAVDEAKKDEAPPADENKNADVKNEAAKPEEAKPEEPRAPQAEGDAEVVKTDEKKAEDVPVAPTDKAAEAPVADAVKTEEAKVDAAATPEVKNEEQNAAATEATKVEAESPTGVVKLGETKVEEVKKETELNQGAGYPLTLGLTVHNVMASSFSISKMLNKDATETPSHLERTIDIGSQYRLVDGEDFKIRAMLDFHNLLHPNITINKSTHMGVELDYSPSGWFKTQVRAGMNQMYFTAGATFLLGVINIDVVTYGEEVGSSSNKIENRVMAAKLSMNF